VGRPREARRAGSLRSMKEVNVWSISCTSRARLWAGVGCGMRGCEVWVEGRSHKRGYGIQAGRWERGVAGEGPGSRLLSGR